MHIRSIWIENEVTGDMFKQANDPIDTNSDVIVTMTDHSRWAATFFSYANIPSLIAKNRISGECLNGRYFWASDMVLVDEVTRERIEQVITDLLTNREFESIFSRCVTDEAQNETGSLS